MRASEARFGSVPKLKQKLKIRLPKVAVFENLAQIDCDALESMGAMNAEESMTITAPARKSG